MNNGVEKFFNKDSKWNKEYQLLRQLVLECGLSEELKWGVPCYSKNKGNVVLIHGFKNYCALLFHKGALLHDEKEILIQQTKNVQSARQIRFSNIGEIEDLKPIIKAYLFEAKEIEKAGLKVKLKETSDFEIPLEFQKRLNDDLNLNEAFNNLTPGRQRGYLWHFSQAKQAKTRESRIDKNLPRILKGVGLNDCTCGLSKRKPNCDGSHRQLKQ
ncbi:MAG: DUF1801 domain-containing protein [Salibacteraceae bacterium]